MIFNREPALIYGTANAVLALVAAFGLHLNAAQIGAILAVTSAVLALATRQAVFSPVTVERDYEPKRDVEGHIEVV